MKLQKEGKMKKIIYLIVFLLMVGMVNASSYIFKQGDEINLKVSCINEVEQPCDSSIECNITTLYPNGTLLIDNQEMTYNTIYYSYFINESDTNVLGQYSNSVFCLGTGNGFSSFSFYINPTGNEITEGQSFASLGLIVIIALLSFLFTWFGFKILDSDSEGAPSIAMFFLLLAMVTAVYSLQLGYIYSTDILYSLGIGGFQFTFLLVILWGLIGVAFVLLLFLLIKTVKMFANKGKGKDGWDNNKY